MRRKNRIRRVTCSALLLVVLGGGCTSAFEPTPAGVAESRREESGALAGPSGAALTVWNADDHPVLVLTDPRRVAAALAALPADAAAALRTTGKYETSDPEVARSHWRSLLDLMDRKLDGPGAEIENTSWGKVKETFS